MRCRLVHAD